MCVCECARERVLVPQDTKGAAVRQFPETAIETLG